MSLNELTPELKQTIPPTDTRLRRDLACHENGDLGENFERFDKLIILFK